MGGTDPENDTAKAVKGITMVDSHRYAVDVVVGRSNRHQEELLALCESLPAAALHVQTIHMASLMSQAHVAITAGGSTTWERCVVGLPGIVVIQSQNQAAIVEAVHKIGGHESLGWSRDVAPGDYGRAIEALTRQSLTRMSNVSASLCDGEGASRVAEHLLS
jgi:UDP-2,4-diacetamido-2,4,6-trideoxy-beta-L-altropyranose hydrolase